MSAIQICRLPIKLAPEASRVLVRPLVIANQQRIINILARVMTLDDETVGRLLADVMSDFADRHSAIERVFARHFEKARQHLFIDRKLSRERELLIGSYFTSEYALESAALFNPSIVPHPDQTGVPKGALRFVMSLRATGEGHISSIAFRSGIIDATGNVVIDPLTRFVTEPEMAPDATYDKPTFALKLAEMGIGKDYSDPLLMELGDEFELQELRRVITATRKQTRLHTMEERRALECVEWLAESNYEVTFPPHRPMCERIIFPISANESNGIEDARFVRFEDDDGKASYYATYTAYNGRVILPQLIETKDFSRFKVSTLNGRAVQNKGMALFPRRIGGRFAMISRQDNENLYLMYSDNVHFWQEAEVLMRPAQPWEFIQLGNCGSPIETDAGWLLLTHGVGPMRKYCIGAILLDREDPSRIIGRLREPLLAPSANEREGYVPNVVYTCGALAHAGKLILPYAMSDFASTIATVEMSDLLAALGS